MKKTPLMMLALSEGESTTLFELSFKMEIATTDGDILYARLKTWQLSKVEAEEIDKKMSTNVHH